MIDLLVDAGAARQAWSGYDKQVCEQLEKNALLTRSDQELGEYRCLLVKHAD